MAPSTPREMAASVAAGGRALKKRLSFDRDKKKKDHPDEESALAAEEAAAVANDKPRTSMAGSVVAGGRALKKRLSFDRDKKKKDHSDAEAAPETDEASGSGDATPRDGDTTPREKKPSKVGKLMRKLSFNRDKKEDKSGELVQVEQGQPEPAAPSAEPVPPASPAAFEIKFKKIEVPNAQPEPEPQPEKAAFVPQASALQPEPVAPVAPASPVAVAPASPVASSSAPVPEAVPSSPMKESPAAEPEDHQYASEVGAAIAEHSVAMALMLSEQEAKVQEAEAQVVANEPTPEELAEEVVSACVGAALADEAISRSGTELAMEDAVPQTTSMSDDVYPKALGSPQKKATATKEVASPASPAGIETVELSPMKRSRTEFAAAAAPAPPPAADLCTALRACFAN